MLLSGLFISHELFLEFLLNLDLLFGVFDFIIQRLILFKQMLIFILILSIEHDIFHILLFIFFQ